jgi:hypothetical protein
VSARFTPWAAVLLVALAGAAPGQDAGWAQTEPLPSYLQQDPPPAGSMFKEMNCYSPVVKRVFVPGSVPAATPRFMNPRYYPYSIGAFNRPFLFDHKLVWYPGYLPFNHDNTGAPLGSFALAYLRGETGVTANLSRGYPEGQRVVEPMLVPYANWCRRGGIFIHGGTTPISLNGATDSPRNGSVEGPDNGTVFVK